MSSRARSFVLLISAPIVTFALVGGLLNEVTAREDTYQHLKIFDDVVGLITGNYVEPVDVDGVMRGAMKGLAEGLDPDSAYLTADQVRSVESDAPLPTADVGIDLTRQYYLRIIATRDGSPAAKAGLRTGDYLRAIDDTPTREMSVFEGVRRLGGAAGSQVTLTIIRGSAADPHVVKLTREVAPVDAVSGRIAAPGVGSVRVAAIGPKAADLTRARIAELTSAGAKRLIVDVRSASGGAVDGGVALARLFLSSGTIAMRESRGTERVSIAARSGDGAVTLPTTLLVDAGTSGAAEIFAAALAGNDRADLVGEHTPGRAGEQTLVKLPDGSGLWLTTARYLTPQGAALHGEGLEPTVAVDQPRVEFGQPEPATDPVLEKALELAGAAKQAA
jgi:carboxyl-terminal processing protease